MIAAQLSQALLERAAEACTRAHDREDLADGFAKEVFGHGAEAEREERIQRYIARTHRADAAAMVAAANHIHGVSPE